MLPGDARIWPPFADLGPDSYDMRGRLADKGLYYVGCGDAQ